MDFSEGGRSLKDHAKKVNDDLNAKLKKLQNHIGTSLIVKVILFFLFIGGLVLFILLITLLANPYKFWPSLEKRLCILEKKAGYSKRYKSDIKPWKDAKYSTDDDYAKLDISQ